MLFKYSGNVWLHLVLTMLVTSCGAERIKINIFTFSECRHLSNVLFRVQVVVVRHLVGESPSARLAELLFLLFRFGHLGKNVIFKLK